MSGVGEKRSEISITSAQKGYSRESIVQTFVRNKYLFYYLFEVEL